MRPKVKAVFTVELLHAVELVGQEVLASQLNASWEVVDFLMLFKGCKKLWFEL